MFAKHEIANNNNLNMRPTAISHLVYRFIRDAKSSGSMLCKNCLLLGYKVQRKIIDQIWICVFSVTGPSSNASLGLVSLMPHCSNICLTNPDDKLPISAFDHFSHNNTIIPDSFIHICNGFHLSPAPSVPVT